MTKNTQKHPVVLLALFSLCTLSCVQQHGSTSTQVGPTPHGLQTWEGYAGGVSICVGDVTGDGVNDIIVAGLKAFKIYENLGGGRFRVVTVTLETTKEEERQ